MHRKRYFNTSGPNIPAEHYTLSRRDLIEKGEKLVNNSRYFTIWAPRQTGKSTYFRLLATELSKQGYEVVHMNFENYRNTSQKSFIKALTEDLHTGFGIDFAGVDEISDVFRRLQFVEGRRFVLIIDEVEGINEDYLSDFLHSIRNAYHSRNTHALKSVILVGVVNITGVIQDNASPFNTNDNLEIPYFTDNEVFELLGQHETETGQLFSQSAQEKIAAITAGQPGLVNGFGERLTGQYENLQVIDYEQYLAVEDWYLYRALDKNVANIINKAKHQQAFMEKLLFTENNIRFDIDKAEHRYLHVNGIIKENKEGNITFWVPLYKKRIQKYFYPTMNGEAEEIQGNIVINAYFTETGMLNMDKIIRGYQEYAARRGFRYFIEKDADGKPKGLLEAALMYSFETYIQSFLQVLKGKSYLEAHVALGRSDLIINVRGQEVVIEGKIYYNITQFTDGKAQLAYYTKGLSLAKGVYLVFVNHKVNHPDVVEQTELIEGVEITTYIVRYNIETDFSEPRKEGLL